jgi:uncharacterized membrane protein YphA (DoxX/SURF4 family)
MPSHAGVPALWRRTGPIDYWAAEILFGLLLLVGWHTRTAALLSGILLTAIGLAMTLALGAKVPLDFSVFSAAGGALLLAGCERFPFSVDGLLVLRSR